LTDCGSLTAFDTNIFKDLLQGPDRLRDSLTLELLTLLFF
jgi:hypothetical protein